jgi:hypothetical protein
MPGESSIREAVDGESRAARGGVWWIGALLLALFSAALRVQLALQDEGFDPVDPRGMLRSDPAELHYLGRRFAEGGLAPAELRADPRIAWPDTTDVLREFTVGQELLVALAARVAPEAPLHVVATVVGSCTASLCILGVFALALEALRSRRLALFSAATCTVLWASYRTVGFVWMREDLSLPLLVATAWASARAGRRGTMSSAALAGALAALSAATWHGAGVGLTALALGIVIAALHTRDPRRAFVAAPPGSVHQSALLACGALTFAAIVTMVPCTAAKGTAFSAPVSLTLATALVLAGKPRARALRVAAAAAVVAGSALVRRAIVGDDLGHVGALLLAKLEHAGTQPEDPLRLAPDVRLMWQGPFEGLSPEALLGYYGLPLVVAGFWLAATLANAVAGRGSPHPRAVGLALATVVLLGLSVLAERVMAFAALALPVAFAAAARAMGGLGAGALGRAAALGLLAVQGLFFLGAVSRHELTWYQPRSAREERRVLVAAVAERVPREAPILTDFLLGPALLADHDRPIVLQPKWETAAARARVHRFLERLYHGTADELAGYMRDEARCAWLLLDYRMLVELDAMRYAAGLRRDVDPLRPGTALGALLGPIDAVPATFELVLEVPRIGVPPGEAPCSARLFELRPR